MVKDLFKSTCLEDRINNWDELLNSVIDKFDMAVDEWNRDYNELYNTWTQLENIKSNKYVANSIRYQMSAYYDTTVIEALADHQFLPRYGFPIGVQKLRVIKYDEDHKIIREEDQYRLARGALLAINEYVPGSQILVGGKLVTSKGLLKHWTGANIDQYIGLRGHYTQCINKHFYYFTDGNLDRPCPVCNQKAGKKFSELLFPKHGFTSAAWDPPKMSSKVEKVGTAEIVTIAFHNGAEKENFGGIADLTARYKEDGEILVYNKGEHDEGFAICLKCGYTDSENSKNDSNFIKKFRQHPALTDKNENNRCIKENEVPPLLHNQALAAKEITDMVLIDFSEIFQDVVNQNKVKIFIITLMYALKRAGAYLLELDERELGCLCISTGSAAVWGWGIIIYDTAAGGAGHSRELFDIGQIWLKKAKDILYINEKHHNECNLACLDCLLSFDTQMSVDKNNIDRKFTYTILDELLKNTNTIPLFNDFNNENMTLSDVVKSAKKTLTKEERLNKAKNKINKKIS